MNTQKTPKKHNKNAKLLDFLDENFRKIVNTNMKFDVDLKKIESEDIKEILDNDMIAQKIDEILWYFNDLFFTWYMV